MNNHTIRIRTKNFSANPLKKRIFTDKRVIVRLGSTTPTQKIFPKSFIKQLPVYEINTVDAIQNSRSKLLMKACFAKNKIPQAEWWVQSNQPGNNNLQLYHQGNDYDNSPITEDNISELPYPILVKRIFGFKGSGMVKLNDKETLLNWLESHKDLDGWYFEKFYNFSREYRLHCTQKEVFMVWRKLRTEDAKTRWFFNSSNCNWIGEDHKLFNKPKNWDEIKQASINALTSTNLDLGAVDVRVQSSRESTPRFIVCEVNSAPALGEQGIQQYHNIIKKILTYAT